MADAKHAPFCDLYESETRSGNRILRGRIGKLSVVGYVDRNLPSGSITTRWNVYVDATPRSE